MQVLKEAYGNFKMLGARPMTDNEDYSRYYLPLISKKCAASQRPALQTAFVEFCDLAQADTLNEETPREYHDHFKSSPFLPRIHKPQVPNETIMKPVASSSCPTLNLTKYKVPVTFTEGISSLSKAKTPLFNTQRTDVLAANLPRDIKLSQERRKSYFSIDPNRSQLDKSNYITLPAKSKALEKKGSIVPKKSNKEHPKAPLMLHFAQDVFNDKKTPRKSPNAKKQERPLTPYYLSNKRPKQVAIFPKVVCVGEDRESLKKTKQNVGECFYSPRGTSCKRNPSLSSHFDVAFGIHNTKLELPFSVLRDSSTLKSKSNSSDHGIKFRTAPRKPDIEEHMTGPVASCVENTKSKYLRFVVKMPSIAGIASSTSPSPVSDLGHQQVIEEGASNNEIFPTGPDQNALNDKTGAISNPGDKNDTDDDVQEVTSSQVNVETLQDNDSSNCGSAEGPIDIPKDGRGNEERSVNDIRLLSGNSPEQSPPPIVPVYSIDAIANDHEPTSQIEFEIIVTHERSREITTQIYSKTFDLNNVQ